MTEQRLPGDHEQRQQALRPDASFIVQAPAGAGKTGLLTQRYLTLLAQAETPEAIVAITFTRKAAGEMRERILGALASARSDAAPVDAHARQGWTLARRVLEQDRRLGWRLDQNPARLRILTFDALAASLSGQMPLLSQFGARPSTVDDPWPLYREAALNTLQRLDEAEEPATAIAHLLGHLDNRLPVLQELIAGMLARRDQWLRHLLPADTHLREAVEAVLAGIVQRHLEHLSAAIPGDTREALLDLLHLAAARVADDTPLAGLRGLAALPDTDPGSLPQWRVLGGWLLTGKGTWRQRLTKNEGFPAADRVAKERMQALLETLARVPRLQDRLAELMQLPAARFSEAEWAVLDALFILLRHAVAELKLVFQTHGEVDFAEISLAALQALGGMNSPSDLLLKLDYRIQHLLVDEFQDTSINQYLLLERLVSGWTPDTGRSLFLVGDPMQSIYRFREAEVGLFLRVKEQGIADLRPQFLQLRVNFRSSRGLIDWVNQGFPRVLPDSDDRSLGAVSYASSIAWHGPLQKEAVVQVCPFIGRDDAAEARRVLGIVQELQAADPAAEESIAILVRGRSHLAAIVPELRAAGLAFNARQIDSLATRPVVNDLLSLTRALLHLGDRISWLALLRAPFCGLSLADLHALCADRPQSAIIDCLRRTGLRDSLSEDGRQRLGRVLPILEAALSQRGRRSLRTWVEGCWLSLGGPAVLDDTSVIEDAEAYLHRLAELDHGGDLDDLPALGEQVASLYAQADGGAGVGLQLMTIHGAKGLEFDHVIVPGLGKPGRHQDPSLLYWLEQTGEESEAELLLGPIKAAGEASYGDTAAYIRRLEAYKQRLENARLLYVAVTRTRQRLYLLGHVPESGSGEPGTPPVNSLLHCLWPVVEDQFEAVAGGQEPAPRAGSSPSPGELPAAAPSRQVIAPDWTCPAPPADIPGLREASMPVAGEVPEFDWAGDLARGVGVVVHRLLETLPGRLDIDVRTLRPVAGQLLAGEGLSGAGLRQAGERVIAALSRTLADERGRWILSDRHLQAHCELPLGLVIDGALRHVVIDRTFIDDHGRRWIIDYKTGQHTGADLEGFLDREQQRYRAQLEGYALAFSRLQANPIRLGLYFPLVQGWREWAWTP